MVMLDWAPSEAAVGCSGRGASDDWRVMSAAGSPGAEAAGR